MDFGDGPIKCVTCLDYIDFGDDVTTKIYVEINVPLQLTRNMIDEYGNLTVCKKCKKHKTSEYKLHRFPSRYIEDTEYEPYNTYSSKIYVWQNPVEPKFDGDNPVFAIVKLKGGPNYYYVLLDSQSENNVMQIKEKATDDGHALSVKLMSIPEAFKQLKKYSSKS